MKLIIGGYAQEKLKYAIEKYGLDSDLVWDGELPGEEELWAVNGERNGKPGMAEGVERERKPQMAEGVERERKPQMAEGTERERKPQRAEGMETGRRIPVVNHFHRWVRKRLSEGGCPEQEIGVFLEKCRDCVIISDEIGNGIVPTEVFEREYRERTGRILVELAKRAEEVERVICGIGQKIK